VMKSLDDPNSLIEQIDTDIYKELKEQNIITDGMLPKLKNAFEALQKGVCKVAIGKPEMIKGTMKHTSITL
ncbi:MAG: acetylglutamate kinase, partial [Flavobacteriaceae bacterium]